MRRLIIAVLVAATFLTPGRATAGSNGGEALGGGNASTSNGGVDVGATYGGGTSSGGGGGGGGGQANYGGGAGGEALYNPCDAVPANLTLAECVGPEPGDTTPPVPRAVDVAADARNRLGLAAPQIHMSPEPPIRSVVGLETWLWLEGGAWGTRSASASAGPTTVTASATPTRIVWDMDESTVVCTNPGTPWVAGTSKSTKAPCGYTYKRPSASQPGGVYNVQVYVTYDISWACTGTCDNAGGDLGALNSPVASVPVRVKEIQTVVTFP